MSKSALVLGASGVSGWAFVNEILHDYPEPNIWKHVYALTNRPLSKEQAKWPEDPRLDIVSGIDLLEGSQADLEHKIQNRLPGITEVTHVFYLAYKASSEPKEELEDAIAMLKRSTIALDHLSSNLEFLVLQIGGKMYGCHLLQDHPTDYLHVPHKESQPRLKQPHHDQLFFHHQLDWIADYAKDRKWVWIDTRPDIIVGFVPNQNFYSLGTIVGIYLSLWKAVYGPGSEAPFPGTEKSWAALSNDSSADMIARQTLYMSLHPSKIEKGTGYNVADARKPSSWSNKWPVICSWFGLKGTGPSDNPPEIRTFIRENFGIWEKLEREHGLQTGHADSPKIIPGVEYWLMTLFDFDRQFDLSKTYGTGFSEERDTLQTWGTTFDRMREARIIP